MELREANVCFICLVILGILITSIASLEAQTSVVRSSPAANSPARSNSRPEDMAGDTKLRLQYMALPLAFEVNEGQRARRIKYLARGRGYELLLTTNQALLHLFHPARTSPSGSQAALGIQLVSHYLPSDPVAEEPLPGTSNYFTGRDPKGWKLGIRQYARVRYHDVYPGIDLVYYGNQQQLESDMVIAPGADPGQVRFRVSGLRHLGLSRNGDLVLNSAAGDVLWRRPMVYQEGAQSKHFIRAVYRIYSSCEFGFNVGAYDRAKPLVIDPVLSYSTYVGGSRDDWFGAATVDSEGNVYAVGMTEAMDFPLVNPLPTNRSYGGGAHDATIEKLNPTGTARLYSTYLGGDGDDWMRGVSVDSAGNAYVTGYTTSSNFPTVNPYQSAFGGGHDAFIAKLGPAGSTLLYSSYLGGTGEDFARAIVADDHGKAYVVGYTNSSSNFPLRNAFQAAYGGGPNDAFLAKFDTAHSGAASLVYSTLLGGGGDDRALAITIDSASNAYVAGYTHSSDFPTRKAYQPSNRGGEDAFVTEINSKGTALVFSTYLGGNGDDHAHGIAVDRTGIYVAGGTTSTDFPTRNPLQSSNRGADDAFLTKLTRTGSALIYSTYYGGSSNEYCLALAVDASGRAYLGGMTGSTDFPVVNPTQANFGGGNFDGFVVGFSASGDQVRFATYIGGNGFDEIQGIAADTSGDNVYAAGETYSDDLPITPGVVQPAYGGGGDAFVARFAMNISSNGLLNTTNPRTNAKPTHARRKILKWTLEALALITLLVILLWGFMLRRRA